MEKINNRSLGWLKRKKNKSYKDFIEKIRNIGHRNKGKKHTEETKKKMSITKKLNPNRYWLGKKNIKVTGKHHGQWKNGKLIKQGYVYVYKKDHPLCTKQGYVAEHHLQMEKKLNRYLRPGEKVHHINGNRLDNRIENLELCNDQSEHMKIHVKGRKRDNKGHLLAYTI